MARTGLYKSEVKKARDALVAQGVNPSVDAVRVALGHTGSKTTIHKYLKELGEEGDGIYGRKASISDTLQDFVARLATQLQDEANARVEEIEAKREAMAYRHGEEIAALKQEMSVLSTKLNQVEEEAFQEKGRHEYTTVELHTERIERNVLEQKVADLEDRLEGNEQHRKSLEEKHQHAREALEHYRASIKEQRDQDQRRHEQQVQQLQAEIRQLQQNLIVKQDDVTRLNQEGVRLVAELSQAQKNLHDQQTRSRELEQKLETLHTIEQQAKAVEVRLSDREFQLKAQKEQLDASTAKTEALRSTVRDLELALAKADAKLSAQKGVVAEIRTYINNRDREQTEAGQVKA